MYTNIHANHVQFYFIFLRMCFLRLRPRGEKEVSSTRPGLYMRRHGRRETLTVPLDGPLMRRPVPQPACSLLGEKSIQHYLGE